MKNFILIFILLLPVICSAQGDFSIGLGGNYLTGKPKNVDVLVRTTALYQYSYRIPIKGKWSFQPGLGLTYTRYIMDGVFSKNNSQYAFGLSPDSFKQSYLQIYSARVPLLARYTFSSYHHPKHPERIKENSVSFGPYVDYIVVAKQHYKTGDKKHKEDALIENKLTFGLCAEVTALRGKSNTGGGVSLSFGAMYQLSGYLSNSSSFKPLLVYLRLGIGGIKRKS